MITGYPNEDSRSDLIERYLSGELEYLVHPGNVFNKDRFKEWAVDKFGTRPNHWAHYALKPLENDRVKTWGYGEIPVTDYAEHGIADIEGFLAEHD